MTSEEMKNEVLSRARALDKKRNDAIKAVVCAAVCVAVVCAAVPLSINAAKKPDSAVNTTASNLPSTTLTQEPSTANSSTTLKSAETTKSGIPESTTSAQTTRSSLQSNSSGGSSMSDGSGSGNKPTLIPSYPSTTEKTTKHSELSTIKKPNSIVTKPDETTKSSAQTPTTGRTGDPGDNNCGADKPSKDGVTPPDKNKISFDNVYNNDWKYDSVSCSLKSGSGELTLDSMSLGSNSKNVNLRFPVKGTEVDVSVNDGSRDYDFYAEVSNIRTLPIGFVGVIGTGNLTASDGRLNGYSVFKMTIDGESCLFVTNLFRAYIFK